ANLVGTVAWRALVFGVPLALAVFLATKRDRWLLPAAVGLLALNPLIVPLRHNGFAWGLFFREPDGQVSGFTRTEAFEKGATYRILRAGDGKVGMYQLVQAGAQLDSEFFPESIDRREWSNSREYVRFLQGRSVEYVMLFLNYDRRFGTNEGSLLETLVGDNCAKAITRQPAYIVYRVRPAECAEPAP
ncbi:MAG: hypothetical protein ABI577_09180, partial [bacterium]